MFNYYQPSMAGQPFQNPYQTRLEALGQPPMGQPQQYDIIRVNGENGARAFRMAPNSRCLLLDETAPIVWLAQTDGAGYPQLTPYSITPYQPRDPNEDLNQRLERLEAIIYGKPSSANAKQTSAQPPSDPQQPDTGAATAPAAAPAIGG